MSSPRHVLLTIPGEHGFHCGMLRDFETEIVRLTGATVVPVPDWPAPRAVRARLAHGTRLSPLRQFAPRRRGLSVDADVLWLVLMGPENSWLDLFRDWDARVGYRIVYVYDTFAGQLSSLRRLAGAARWDMMITSFHGAVPMLNRETGREWIAVPQGVKLDRFAPVPAAHRVIGVGSYGRRLELVHQGIDAWSNAAGIHYDVTVAATLDQHVPVGYLYKQYAFHLRHSWFSVGWPTERTHPSRAGDFSPVTCRWFEAAASATTVIGEPPTDPMFAEMFGERSVLPLDPTPRSPGETREAMAALWEKRNEHLAAAEQRRAERAHTWTWEARVREILSLAGLPCVVPPG